jgi:hypothetical protein
MARTSLLTAGTRQRPPGPVFLEHWHETSFDWLTWSGGSLTNLGVQYNSKHIAAYLHVLRKHAIAWCDGAKVLCRPKPGRIAVMFRLDDWEFWTHLRTSEFRICFPEVPLS